MKVVKKIADKLCNDAIWYENKCNWVGTFHDTQIANAQTTIRALPSNFYNGSAGVAYFLSAAYHQFKKPIYKKTALGAYEKTLGRLHKIKAESIGFYEGVSGIAYSLFQSSKWLAEPRFLQNSKSIIDDIALKTTNQWGLEVQDGCPSAIPVLIILNEYFQDLTINDLIENIGEFILAKAIKTPEGWYWADDDKTAKVGYAHGLAGLAHALSELYKHTQQYKYLEALEQVIKFENSFYKPHAPNHYAAWCVGSVGIGFSRWLSHQVSGNENHLFDFQSSLKNSLLASETTSQYFTLCHGFFGNMALLRNASENGFVAKSTVIESVNSILESRQEFQKLLPDGKDFMLANPTFMLGWAGIAYFLLQLHYPSDYPEMLLITHLKAKKKA
jgi:lantibiotic biosynthesis protein